MFHTQKTEVYNSHRESDRYLFMFIALQYLELFQKLPKPTIHLYCYGA